MFGNVIKTLFAKMMSSHYYKASQFEKLQDALKKARLALPCARLQHDQFCGVPPAALVLLCR